MRVGISVQLQRPRGTQDIFPASAANWQAVESVVREVAQSFGYGEIRTPVFEHGELFTRGVGDTSDIVEKEMYELTDRGGRHLVLRPESTAPVVRAVLQASLLPDLPLRFYYMQSHFRYERPQSGRLRQHHQFGIELFGAPGPLADAEVISVAHTFLGRLGLPNLEVAINSIGCADCRPTYRVALVEHLTAHREELCGDCQRRLERNPLRVLDCKVPGCRAVVEVAPKPIDHLCDNCRTHLLGVESALTALQIPFHREPALVRGLDYYTRTVFELHYANLGAQSTVCGGGRYDGLMREIGGPPVPAVGFGLGLERLILSLESEGLLHAEAPRPDVAVLYIGDELGGEALRVAAELRSRGLRAEAEVQGKSPSATLRRVQKLGIPYAVILGPKEFAQGLAAIRDMSASDQSEVPVKELADHLSRMILRDPGSRNSG